MSPPCLILKPNGSSFSIVDTSKNFLKTFGSTNKNLVGKSIEEIFPCIPLLKIHASLTTVISTLEKDQIHISQENLLSSDKKIYSSCQYRIENIPMLINDKVIFIQQTFHITSNPAIKSEKQQINFRKRTVSLPASKMTSMTGSFENVAATRKLAEEIRQQNLLLEQIAWEQSHLVRAPLARLKGLLELFRQKDHTTMEREKILSSIENSAEELDKVVREIIAKTEKE